MTPIDFLSSRNKSLLTIKSNLPTIHLTLRLLKNTTNIVIDLRQNFKTMKNFLKTVTILCLVIFQGLLDIHAQDDCDYPPDVRCFDGIKVALINGPVLVWPEDFAIADFPVCQIDVNLTYKLNVHAPNTPGANEPYEAVDTWTLDCDDLGEKWVEIWVSEGEDNWGMCETIIEVTDPPVFSCPSNVTISCADDHNDLKLTGNLKVTTYCDGNLIVNYSDLITSNECEDKIIKRTWTYIDGEGNEIKACQQEIIVETLDPISASTINWPNDLSFNDCDTKPETLTPQYLKQEPIINQELCKEFYFNHHDEITKICDKGYQILRTWTIIDWCNGLIYQHTQKITLVCGHTTMAICNDRINISLDKNGCAILTPDIIDEGSYDLCGSLLKFSLSLDDKHYDEKIKFDCSELGSHKVIMMVENEYGGSDKCQTEIIVEDKSGVCKKKINNIGAEANTTHSTLQVYPNPTQDFIRIHLNVHDQTFAYLIIRDQNGRVLRTESNLKIGQQELRFNTSDFSNNTNLLIIEVFDGKQIELKKVIVIND